MDSLKVIKRILQVLLVLSIIVFIYSYINKDKLPEVQKIKTSLLQDPIQSEIEMNPFEVQKEDFVYEIIPKYTYEIWGLVVADYDSESWFDWSHKNDPLNTKDICVIWGDNVESDVYQKMKYSHGEWTCYAEFRSGVDPYYYDKFNPVQVSNNHILPKDDKIYKAAKDAAVGDQVYFKGFLVDYKTKKDQQVVSQRETSSVREDSGCEVVYVNDFKIIAKGDTTIRNIYNISKYTIIGCFLLLLLLFIIPLFVPRKRELKD